MLARLEQEHYGVSFALYLRFELHLTLPKILEVTKSACKQYIRELDRYEAKIAYYHPYRKGVFIKVPRLAPPASSSPRSSVTSRPRLEWYRVPTAGLLSGRSSA